MTINDWLRERQGIAGPIFIVLALGLAAYLFFGRNGMPDEYRMDYFYDLGSDELFIAPRDALSPIDAPTGQAQGVKAAVFSCGDCADKATHFVAWLERYSPEARDAMRAERESASEEVAPGFNQTIKQGHEVAFPNGELTWSRSSTPQSVARMRQVLQRCRGDKRPHACNPHPDDL